MEKKEVNWRHIRREASGNINQRVRGGSARWLNERKGITTSKITDWPPRFTLRPARSVHACFFPLERNGWEMTKSDQSPTNDSKRRSALMGKECIMDNVPSVHKPFSFLAWVVKSRGRLTGPRAVQTSSQHLICRKNSQRANDNCAMN